MVHVVHNISYTDDKNEHRNRLDVYYSSKATAMDVLIFVPGGKWKKGSKNKYKYLGHNFVHKGVVTVVIDYSLLPNVVDRMAQDCVAAVMWTYNHISHYGGNPNRIFVMGYSAGGHLVELINSDCRFFNHYGVENPMHGVILLDAFGLDMQEYLSKESSKLNKTYKTCLKVFSDDPQNWHRVSPMTYWKHIRNPHLFLIGGRTYPSIKAQNVHLFGNLTSSQRKLAELYEIRHRNHKEMIIYMFFGRNQQYDIISGFMKRN